MCDGRKGDVRDMDETVETVAMALQGRAWIILHFKDGTIRRDYMEPGKRNYALPYHERGLVIKAISPFGVWFPFCGSWQHE